MMTIAGERFPAKYLLLLIFPFLADVLLYFYMLLTGSTELQNTIEAITASIDNEQAVGVPRIVDHVFWQISGLFHIFVCYISVYMSVTIINNRFRHNPRFMAIVYTTLIFMIIFISVFVLLSHSYSGSVSEAISRALFSSWADRSSNDVLGSISRATVFWAMFISNLSGLIAFCSLSTAAFATMSLPVVAESEDANFVLSTKLSNINKVLYAGSACLFTGVIAMNTFFSWRAGLLNESSDIFISIIFDLGQSMTVIWVAIWSFSMGLLYFYSLWWLKADINLAYSHARRNRSDVSRKSWLEENELGTSSAESLLKIAALIGPLVTGASVPPS